MILLPQYLTAAHLLVSKLAFFSFLLKINCLNFSSQLNGDNMMLRWRKGSSNFGNFLVGYINRLSTLRDMGCLASRPKDPSGNRSRPTNIGDVSVYVPGMRIPKPVDFFESLGTSLPRKIVEHLSAMRTRIVVMVGHEASVITRTRRKNATQHGACWHTKKKEVFFYECCT